MDSQRITEHFRWEEVTCPCCDRVRIMPAFWKHMEALEKLRVTLGFPIIVNSGYRCEKHNAKVGGSVGSMHMLIATDIRPNMLNMEVLPAEREGLTAGRLQELYDRAPEFGFTGRGRYDSFVHLDMRAEPLDWRG